MTGDQRTTNSNLVVKKDQQIADSLKGSLSTQVEHPSLSHRRTMGRRRRRRRHREATMSAMPSCTGNIKINEASAMLLYQAPSGITIFSFDEAYLNNSVKDFWEDIPQLTLEFFLKYERVSTPIDLANEAIDDRLTEKLTRLCGKVSSQSLKEFIKREEVSTPFDPANEAIDDNLAKRLTRHCGSQKKLVVGSAQHKTIIEKKLGITCLYVNVLDCEVIKCSLKNPMCSSLLEEKSDTSSKELITFLRQHDYDVKPEMVNESLAELARLLYDVKLREMRHFNFLRILLKDFTVTSGIDTNDWSLSEFATVLKMICCPGASYEVYHPRLIFSADEYQNMEANASRYKRSFSKIGASSVYEEVFSLYSEKCLLLLELDILVDKAKVKINEASPMLLYEAPSGMAIFSFDGVYFDNSVKDFWVDIPHLSLKEFINREEVSTPFDPANEDIDDNLAKRLTRHCGTQKKLVVGSAQHKTIIEKKLGITCLYVNVLDCEVIKSSLKNPMCSLLHEEKSETSSKELITFLRQHDYDVKPGMVNESLAELARLLYDVELREMRHFNFLRILLKDFTVTSGIDTNDWSLSEFATVLKMICCPGASYKVYHPRLIFSADEYGKMEANAYRYKPSLSKVGALCVYEDVFSLYSEKCLLLHDLDSFVEKAKDAVQEKLSENMDEFQENEQTGDIGDDRKKLTGHTGNEERNLPGNRDTCVGGMGGDKNPASSYISNSEKLKGQYIDTSMGVNKTIDDDKYEQARDLGAKSKGVSKTTPEITSDDDKDVQAKAAGRQSKVGDGSKLSSAKIFKSGTFQAWDRERELNEASFDGDAHKRRRISLL